MMSERADIEEKLSRLASRAASDESLKDRLLHDTTRVLVENKVEIPAGTEPQATLDNDAITFQFAPLNGSSELTDQALSQAVGGAKDTKGTIYLVFKFKLAS
jgi:hypothetical protein